MSNDIQRPTVRGTPSPSARPAGIGIPKGNYDGKELKRVEVRPGSLQFLNIPSLAGSTRTYPYGRSNGIHGEPTPGTEDPGN